MQPETGVHWKLPTTDFPVTDAKLSRGLHAVS